MGRTFTAKTKDGEEHTIYESTPERIRIRPLDEPPSEIAGFKTLQLVDGTPVRRHGKGRYEIFDTGVMLFSDDPNAP